MSRPGTPEVPRGRLVLVVVGAHVRQAVAAVFSGVPSNVRLRVTVGSRRARRARDQAWADLRDRLAELTATESSLHLLCSRFVDHADRSPRVGRVPLFGSHPRRGDVPALTATVHVDAYLGAEAASEDLLRALGIGVDPLAWRATHPPDKLRGRWIQDSPDRPLRWPADSARHDRCEILRTEHVEPADFSLDAARAQYGTLMRFSAHTTYLSVPRHPWLHRLQRLWRRLKQSGKARSGLA